MIEIIGASKDLVVSPAPEIEMSEETRAAIREIEENLATSLSRIGHWVV